MANAKLRVGITGSTGVTGRTLALFWKEKNIELVPFRGDITKQNDVKNWYQEVQPLDGLIHLAALVPVHLVEAAPLEAFKINALGTFHILEEIRTSSSDTKPWMFYSSTSHVYPTSNDPISEDIATDPINMYGETKAQGDKWCQIYAHQFNLPICTGRIFSCSSPLQPKTYFVPAMVERIKSLPKGALLEARGLNGTRDFLTTLQICQAIDFLFRKKITGVYNLASGQPMKLLDMVEIIKRRLNRPDIIVKAQDLQTHHLVANVQKLASAGLRLDFNSDRFLDYVLSDQSEVGFK